MIEVLTSINIFFLAPLNPVWATVFALLCIACSAMNIKSPKWLLKVLVVGIVLAHFYEFGQLYGRLTSSSLIVCAVGLKFFEKSGQRDFFTIAATNFFVIVFVLLDRNDILTTIAMFFSFSIIAAMLFKPTTDTDFKKVFRLGTFTFLLSIPLAAVLFVLVPQFRIDLPALSRESAKTGFSGDLVAGQVTSLAQSNTLAFQAHFGKSPPGELYWRGLVMQQCDGLQWNLMPIKSEKKKSSQRRMGEVDKGNTYELLFPADRQKWIFTLENTGELNRSGKVISRNTRNFFQDSVKRTVRTSYQAILREVKPDRPTEDDLTVSSLGLIPRTRDMATRLKAETTDATVRNIVNWLIRGSFAYTLTPEPVSTVDEFLFETRSGFCEHFAASLGTMMRLADVPTRLILGFHGGDIAEDFVTVRNRDAHAWLSFWSDEQAAWLRFDPTSLVAKDRLTLGAFEYRNQNTPQWLEYPQRIWNQTEAYWYRYILSFDRSRQLAWMNLDSSAWGIWILLFIATGVMVALYVVYLKILALNLRPLHQVVYDFLSLRWRRHKNEGPRTWANRLGPRRRDTILAYEKIVYQDTTVRQKREWIFGALTSWLISRD